MTNERVRILAPEVRSDILCGSLFKRTVKLTNNEYKFILKCFVKQMYTPLEFVTTQFRGTFSRFFISDSPGGYMNIIIVIFDARFCICFKYMKIGLCINI